MTAVFVDTAYFIARTRQNDQWRQAAETARAQLGNVSMVTTDEVLAEFLTALSKSGEAVRRRAALTVREALTSGAITVVPQSRQSLLDGLDLYERRLDKGYSLQDCVSMRVMEEEGITDVLTSDHNFEQEGFTVLMKRS
ncbi:MAG: PIN domain-containing protein [Chloroflexi bacterium]|nr:PIN domain-containing protein [Chloroflexota bacterium]MYF80236.1 PIN domain-containing protein [Chloroflexota bacterium]MYI04062.1 PIN domain-containing protein [Chloroflexota bacterium]